MFWSSTVSHCLQLTQLPWEMSQIWQAQMWQAQILLRFVGFQMTSVVTEKSTFHLVQSHMGMSEGRYWGHITWHHLLSRLIEWIMGLPVGNQMCGQGKECNRCLWSLGTWHCLMSLGQFGLLGTHSSWPHISQKDSQKLIALYAILWKDTEELKLAHTLSF